MGRQSNFCVGLCLSGLAIKSKLLCVCARRLTVDAQDNDCEGGEAGEDGGEGRRRLHGGGGREDNRFVVLVNYIVVLLLGVAEGLSKDGFFFGQTSMDFAGFENLFGILELISELVFPNIEVPPRTSIGSSRRRGGPHTPNNTPAFFDIPVITEPSRQRLLVALLDCGHDHALRLNQLLSHFRCRCCLSLIITAAQPA